MAKIGIFDSGVGGLSVLSEIKKILPDSTYYYYGDNANCPYGIKGPDFIKNRSDEIAQLLFSKGIDAMVVACNTATSYAVEYLCDSYPIPILGTVPGVKPAAADTKTGVVGVLATFGTLNAPLYNRIRDKWGADVQVLEHIGEGFVELVESFELSGSHAEEVVLRSVEPLVSKGADVLVLGCTHYPFLSETILKVANEIKPQSTPCISIYNPAPAVANHLLSILKERNVPIAEECPTVELLTSGSGEVLRMLYG